MLEEFRRTMMRELDGFEEPLMRRMVVDLVGRYQDAPVKDFNIGRIMIEMARSANQLSLRMPSELALLGKTLLSLHEIGLILAPEFDVNASMRQNATSLMRRPR